MKVVVVYNAGSGSAMKKDEINQLLTDNDIEALEYIPIAAGFEAELRDAMHHKAPTVIAIGGDGTMGSVAQIVSEEDGVLIPLPGGTLNHFTKDLGVNQDLVEAVGLLKNSTVRSVDMATVNRTIFVNNASIGLYSRSLRMREQAHPGFGKWLAATGAVIWAFIQFRTYTITIDGTQYRTPFLFIGNNHYDGSDIGIPSRKQINEGILTVWLTEASSRLELLYMGWLLFLGKAGKHDKFKIFYTGKLTVAARRSFISVSHDGEVSSMSTPLEFAVLAGKLKVQY